MSVCKGGRGKETEVEGGKEGEGERERGRERIYTQKTIISSKEK